MTDVKTPRYSIIFHGELVDGVSRQVALDNLAHLTNLSEEELLDCLFSVKPVIAAQADNYHLADQFKDQFHEAGLKVSTLAYDPSHDDIVNADLTFGHYAPLEKQYTKANFVVDTSTPKAIPESEIHQPKGKFLVTFNGSLRGGYKRKQVMENLCSLTNSAEQEVLEDIFSAVPVILCQTNNPDLAKNYKESFEEAGLETELLNIKRLSNPEIVARCHLLIRDDKPAPLPQKKVQGFTFTLYGLALLSCLAWVAIYMVIDSFLQQDASQSIQVELVQYKTVEKAPEAAPKPVIEKKPVKKPEPVKQPKIVEKKPVPKETPPPVQEQKKQVKPPPPPEPKPEPKKVVKKKENKQQQKFKGEYNLQLLMWFAQFQQVNQLESKYAEGEITLRLTIARNGDIKNIEVLKSTSEELQRIVVMQLRKAKKVPGIPIKITGDEYTFDLPLRYRFD